MMVVEIHHLSTHMHACTHTDTLPGQGRVLVGFFFLQHVEISLYKYCSTSNWDFFAIWLPDLREGSTFSGLWVPSEAAGVGLRDP